MKRFLPALLGALLIATPLTHTGCALFSSTSTQEQKLADVQRLAYAAASLGTQEALLQNATWKPQFVVAYGNLDTLVRGKVVTGALLRQVIASLPVKELKSPQARLAIDAALTLYDVTAGTKVDLEQVPYALAAATGVRDGLKAALGL
jgi:hypothetical protein